MSLMSIWSLRHPVLRNFSPYERVCRALAAPLKKPVGLYKLLCVRSKGALWLIVNISSPKTKK